MTHDNKTFWDKAFKDKDGRITVWQWPNIPIYGWLAFRIFAQFTHGHIHIGSLALSMAFLFTWAYLEITSGVNYFRRALGVIVMIAIVVGFFR